MAVSEKIEFDAATRELWRVAETGKVDDLVTLLPRVPDINASNEHGMNALMRAAQRGDVSIARALLEHGADPKRSRNDKFTPLALAAFFGHGEMVRTLMEYGADAGATTRANTSPRMWATARTFDKVAVQIENRGRLEFRKPAPAKVAPAPQPAPPLPLAPQEEVKTLKDPPEIWELVHEVPKGFKARTAFASRLRSTRTRVVAGLFAAIILVACTLGVIVFKDAQAGHTPGVQAPPPVVSFEPPPAASDTRPIVTEPPVDTTPVVTTPVVNTSAGVTTRAAPRTRSRSQRAPSLPGSQESPRAESALTVPVPQVTTKPAPPPKTTTEPETKTSATANAPLGSRLIAPAKNASRKARVIQWP